MRMRQWFAMLALAVTWACADAVPTASRAPGDDPLAAQRAARVIPGEWVVQFHSGTDNPRGRMNALVAQSRGTLKSEHLDIAGAFVIRLPDQAAQALLNNPNVRSVTPNVRVEMASTQTNAPWALDRLDRRTRPNNGTFEYGQDGTGVHVYLFDSGLDPQHVEFGSRVLAGVSTVGDNIGVLDGCGHGARTAGAVGATTYGVAKGAWLHAVKVMDKYCFGDVSATLNGIAWIKANHIKPAVVSSSLIFYQIVPAVDSAVLNLINTTGVQWVQSAGNGAGQSCDYSPGRVPKVLTVAAVDSFDVRTSWSAVGTCVDIYAPGMEVRTTNYNYWSTPNNHTLTIIESGTSMSAPYVAGVIASYLQANPSATATGIHSHIINSATAGAVQFPGIGTPNRLLYQAPPPPPPPPQYYLNVSISGANPVPAYQSCGYSAGASGGTGGPYTFTWYADGQVIGTGDYIMWSTGSNYTLSVVADDGNGMIGSTAMSITVSAEAWSCYDQ
jgi:subtilisin family serine protease